MKKNPYLDSFEEVVRTHLATIEQQSTNIELYIERKNKEEREISNKSYAPLIAWTILLGILGMFGVAIVMSIIKSIGLNPPI